MFVIWGFKVKRSNAFLIPKARKSIKKGCAWILLSLGSRSI